MRPLPVTLLSLVLACQTWAQPRLADVHAVLSHSALQPGQQAVIAVVLDITNGYHAQSHSPLDKNLVPLTVELLRHPQVEFSAPLYPQGQVHDYAGLGKVSVYTGRVIVYVPLLVHTDAVPEPIQLRGNIRYQICDENTCFPPQQQTFQIDSAIVPPGQTVAANQPELFTDFDPTALARSAIAGVSLFGRQLTSDAYLLAFAGALVVGMLFNVMPCVLPIVPLKAMGFYQAAQQHRGRSLTLGAVFAAGIVATFAALAIPVVVLQKFAWGEMFSNPYFAAFIVVVLIGLAMHPFGVYNVVLPARLYNATVGHDTYVGNFVFGVLTAILSTPCTFGMFLGLLVWAASQPPLLGMMLVMAVGLGMALPYLALAAFPELARRLPRSGIWAEIVKQMMAFLLLATAVYFGRRFLPDSLRGEKFWWILFAVIAAAGAFLIIRTIQLARRAVPVIVASITAALIIAPALAVTLRLTYTPIAWVKYSPDAFQQALQSGRPVLIKFTADWCGNCQAIEATVFVDDRTVQTIRQMQLIPIKADLTSSDAAGWPLLRRLHPVGAIPFTIIYLPNRTEPRTLTGIYSTDDLLEALKTSSTQNPS